MIDALIKITGKSTVSIKGVYMTPDSTHPIEEISSELYSYIEQLQANGFLTILSASNKPEGVVEDTQPPRIPEPDVVEVPIIRSITPLVEKPEEVAEEPEENTPVAEETEEPEVEEATKPKRSRKSTK